MLIKWFRNKFLQSPGLFTALSNIGVYLNIVTGEEELKEKDPGLPWKKTKPNCDYVFNKEKVCWYGHELIGRPGYGIHKEHTHTIKIPVDYQNKAKAFQLIKQVKL